MAFGTTGGKTRIPSGKYLPVGEYLSSHQLDIRVNGIWVLPSDLVDVALNSRLKEVLHMKPEQVAYRALLRLGLDNLVHTHDLFVPELV